MTSTMLSVEHIKHLACLAKLSPHSHLSRPSLCIDLEMPRPRNRASASCRQEILGAGLRAGNRKSLTRFALAN